MPKRTDIKTILIIGAGPIIIGQACEFDYSGAQACKALREEGFKGARVVRVVLLDLVAQPAGELLAVAGVALAVRVEPRIHKQHGALQPAQLP